jgi:dCMP deaminase
MKNPGNKVKWYRRFLAVADLAASWSKDTSKQVGSAIYNPETRSILSVGYNGLVRGMDDENPAFHERPLKYALFEHAERNAIFNSVRHGIRLEGMGIAVTWPPCADCARAVVQSGISEVIVHEPKLSPEELTRWAESMAIAEDILQFGKVTYMQVRKEEL